MYTVVAFGSLLVHWDILTKASTLTQWRGMRKSVGRSNGRAALLSVPADARILLCKTLTSTLPKPSVLLIRGIDRTHCAGYFLPTCVCATNGDFVRLIFGAGSCSILAGAAESASHKYGGQPQPKTSSSTFRWKW